MEKGGDELSSRSSKKLRKSLDINPEDGAGGPVNIQVEATPAQETKKEPPKTTFKALGNVVLAMQRFKASLNPTYTYGRQTASPSPSLSLEGKSSRSGGAVEHGSSGAEHSSKYAYSDRGHRASLLLAPLPNIDQSGGEE